MISSMASISDLLKGEESLQVLQADAERLGRKYAVFLVDHGRASRSTHKFWWNHFEEAARLLGIPCRRVSKASETWPTDHRREGRRGVYLFFTRRSLYHDRWCIFRSVRREAIRPEDIVASWDPRVMDELDHAHAFLIGFRGGTWMSLPGLPDSRQIVFWEPFAPLSAVEKGVRESGRTPRWDFSYFGTLNPHNYDQFQRILQPLAARHRCRYAGKLWRIASLIPLRYGFRPFLVHEDRGQEILLEGRINLVLHNDYHRRMRTLTERLFVSAALGRPVVCDNAGAWRYFSQEEVPVAEDPEMFLALCEDSLRNLQQRREIAREIQRKTLRHNTYLHTVVQLLTELDAKASSRGGV
ncbi:MAG: glycosyltransferase [Armatimonadota bacterium]|nr:glycosyltransferase [Armatimonadota bacterium]